MNSKHLHGVRWRFADVVLLCFDSQSQQASEFAKVADWVRHYGKPTIAVLNIRNLRWRHPAKMPNQVAREHISMPVRQHRDNIRSELSNIGLPDTPVVAVHSRRALFARATPPYRGPAEPDFLSDRKQFGVAYLAQWSNFGVLESLLTAVITCGGSQLRLTSLREGMRAILLDEATNLESLHRRLSERADEIDRAASRYLKALGYLEDDERSCFLHDDEWCGDLLTLAESARGRPYRASEGAFSRYVRTLLKPQLTEPKSNAVRRFKDLERRAFEDKPDPFSVVGGLQPVSRMDYEANRSWDGIDPLMRALAAIPDDTVAHAHTLAGLDRAADDLLR